MDFNLIKNQFAEIAKQYGAYVVKMKIAVSKVTIILDTDYGITLVQLTEVSRSISRWYSEQGLDLPRIEVSSPGAFEPFTDSRGYQKNIGRLISVEKKMLEPDIEVLSIKGKLLAVDDEGFEIECKSGTTRILFEDVKRSKVILK